MIITSKGRYALRVMIDLAQHGDEGYISLKDVAKRQDISMKYLEMIAGCLNKAGLIVSMRGKSGGYRVAMPPESCTVGAVVRATEGSLTPVKCAVCEGDHCEKEDDCYTLPVWQELDRIVEQYLESVSLADLLAKGHKTVTDCAGSAASALAAENFEKENEKEMEKTIDRAGEK